MGSWRIAVESLKIWWLLVMFLQELSPAVALGKEGPHFVTESAHIWIIWPKLSHRNQRACTRLRRRSVAEERLWKSLLHHRSRLYTTLFPPETFNIETPSSLLDCSHYLTHDLSTWQR